MVEFLVGYAGHYEYVNPEKAKERLDFLKNVTNQASGNCVFDELEMAVVADLYGVDLEVYSSQNGLTLKSIYKSKNMLQHKEAIRLLKTENKFASILLRDAQKGKKLVTYKYELLKFDRVEEHQDLTAAQGQDSRLDIELFS